MKTRLEHLNREVKKVSRKQEVLRVAKDLETYDGLHEDSEPEGVAWLLQEFVAEHNALEKKHNKLVAQLRKLMESCDENI